MTFNKFIRCYWPPVFAAACFVLCLALSIIKQDKIMYIITGVVALVLGGTLWLGVAKDRAERQEENNGESKD